MKGLITLALLLAPGTLFAQSALDGTWRIDPQSMTMVGTEKYSLQNGVYRCDSCSPKIELKADGQDHKVSGSPYSDAFNVRAVDDHTVEVVSKKDGKVVGTLKLTASEDGNELANEFTFVTGGGQNGAGKYSSTRVGTAPTGANKISGVWQPGPLQSATESMVVVTYKATGDGLSMSDQTGDSYSAKFDGKEYPFKGDPGVTSVSLKKIDANTIEETAKRNGKVISVNRITLAPDGKTLSFVFEDKLRDVTYKSTATKQ
jgi:hypothetical protein